MTSSVHRTLLGTHSHFVSSRLHSPWFFPALRCSSFSLLSLWAVVMTVVACLSIFRPAAFRADSRHQACGFDDLDQSHQRVAICLVGGAREFQLTGPSVASHLLSAYASVDVFILAPLDADAHKLSLLAAPHSAIFPPSSNRSHPHPRSPSTPPWPPFRLALLRVLPDVPINETQWTSRLISTTTSSTGTGAGSEHSLAWTRQSLLQQFKAVEGCVSAIEEYEQQQGFKYDWVLRTRTDTYWMGPPPPLNVLDKQGYTIPGGSDWGGLNDRLGVGPRSISLPALQRLSVVRPLVEQGGYHSLNAERVYLAQMAFLKVKVARYDFPFCILSHKKGLPAFPVAAALSSAFAALNGAKCRPCTPSTALAGAAATAYISSLPERIFGAESNGVELCMAEGGWEEGWRDRFDADAGETGGAVRRYMEGRTIKECERDWKRLHALAHSWSAPPALSLCVRGQLGALHKMGYPGGDFPVFLDPFLPPRAQRRKHLPVIYSVVAGVDYAFDWAFMRRIRGCRVHAFDSAPAGLQWIAARLDSLPKESWLHHPWLMAPRDGLMQVYEVNMTEHPIEYATSLPQTVSGVDVTSSSSRGGVVPSSSSSHLPSFQVDVRSVESSMRALNHSLVDILRIGGHRSMHEGLLAAWVKRRKAPAVCQIVLSFHLGDKHYGSPEFSSELAGLRRIGLELAGCIAKDQHYESCVLFSVQHCQYDDLPQATASSSNSGSSSGPSSSGTQ